VFEELWILEDLRVLLLFFLEVCKCLLPGDSVDEISNHVENVLFFFGQRKVYLDVFDVGQELLLEGDAAFVGTSVYLKHLSRVSWKAH